MSIREVPDLFLDCHIQADNPEIVFPHLDLPDRLEVPDHSPALLDPVHHLSGSLLWLTCEHVHQEISIPERCKIGIVDVMHQDIKVKVCLMVCFVYPLGEDKPRYCSPHFSCEELYGLVLTCRTPPCITRQEIHRSEFLLATLKGNDNTCTGALCLTPRITFPHEASPSLDRAYQFSTGSVTSFLNVTEKLFVSLVVLSSDPARTLLEQGYTSIPAVKVSHHVREHPAEHIIQSLCCGCLRDHPVDNGELLVPCLDLLFLNLSG
ncbi:MAG: hypothetical protein A4E42_01533 [Methanoregulaceae archaeon PtaU1.Bin222]|nr:MAG: hypothetical protein A4E42_01533 [Methanoregulaceae archaeon PtaU1.Bin222]